MSEAGWTRATDVTQPGWYWLRRVGSLTVVQVIAVPGYEQRHWIVEGVNLRWSLGNMDGEFLGPISLDSYKQGRVEGLREAAIICRERGKPHDIQWWMTASKKEVSAQTAIDCAELIEQYAQDEKGVMDAEN